jgi:hypothetical protein
MDLVYVLVLVSTKISSSAQRFADPTVKHESPSAIIIEALYLSILPGAFHFIR